MRAIELLRAADQDTLKMFYLSLNLHITRAPLTNVDPGWFRAAIFVEWCRRGLLEN